MKHIRDMDRGERTPQRCVLLRRLHGLPQLAAVAMACALMGLPCLRAQDSKPAEYEVKAAYLYNFGRFTQWPAKAAAAEGRSFAICVLGDDPFGPALFRTVAGETIDGQYVVAKGVLTARDAGNCRILFISSSEDSKLRESLEALGNASVLTVSDMPQFVRRGGMIQFLLQDKKVRFEVNLTAAERAGLALSSEVLKLAVQVKRGARLGD